MTWNVDGKNIEIIRDSGGNIVNIREIMNEHGFKISVNLMQDFKLTMSDLQAILLETISMFGFLPEENANARPNIDFAAIMKNIDENAEQR